MFRLIAAAVFLASCGASERIYQCECTSSLCSENGACGEQKSRRMSDVCAADELEAYDKQWGVCASMSAPKDGSPFKPEVQCWVDPDYSRECLN